MLVERKHTRDHVRVLLCVSISKNIHSSTSLIVLVSILFWAPVSVMPLLTTSVASDSDWLKICSCCSTVFGLMSYSLTLGALNSALPIMMQFASIAQWFLSQIATSLSRCGGISFGSLLPAVLLLVVVVAALLVIAVIVVVVVVVVGMVIVMIGCSFMIKLPLVLITSLVGLTLDFPIHQPLSKLNGFFQ